MITDAQIHLWEADRPDRPMQPDAKPSLPEPMTAERMLALMDEAGVERAVINPVFLPDWAPDYGLEVAARYPKRFRVMGWFWPEQPRQFDLLPRWFDNPYMCSLRMKLDRPELAGRLLEAPIARLWSDAERYGIPVAFWFEHQSALAIGEVARRHPGLKLIVDHLNWPLPPAPLEQKVSELEQLAVHPNLYVKVSSLPRFSRTSPPFDDLHPYLKRVHAAYGARRLMWGSDQTQVIAHAQGSYRDNVDIIRKGAARYLPAADIDWMLNGTAAEVFRWAE